MAKSLLDARRGIIDHIAEHPLKARMLELGLRAGKYIQLIQNAPSRHVHMVRVDQQVYAMRDSEIRHIFIQ